MQLVDGRYECAHCGALLELDADAEPTIVFHAASGRPNMRVITVDGHEIHRCEVKDLEPGYPKHQASDGTATERERG
jgi:hypothetical protein